MGLSRAEMEALGFLPGEGPEPQVDVVDTGAFRDIENLARDFADPIDVEHNPFLPQVTDNDGVPGFRPFVDASNRFDKGELGLSVEPDDTGDELAEIIERREVAAIGEDGQPVSDIMRLARADGIKKEQIATKAPFTRINPETAYTGLLGGQASLTKNSSTLAPDPVQVISWSGEDVEACPVTLTLTPIYTVATGAVTPEGGVRAYAIIQWGTRDGTQDVKVDLGNGVQLTLGASAITVSLALEDTSVVLGSVRMTASLAFYPCVRTTPATYTSYMELAAGASTTIARPRFAAQVYCERAGTDGFTLDFIQSDGTITIYSRAVASSAYLNDPVKLSNDVAFVKVTNNSGATTRVMRLIWGLHL